MVLPCLLALLALPSPALALAAFLASLLPAALLGTSLGQQVGFFFSSLLASISVVSLPLHHLSIVNMQAAPLLQSIVSLYIEKRNFVNNFGLNTFLEAEWARLRVPAVLRTFWISRAALLLILQVSPRSEVETDEKTMNAEMSDFRKLSLEGTWQPACPLLVHDG